MLIFRLALVAVVEGAFALTPVGKGPPLAPVKAKATLLVNVLRMIFTVTLRDCPWVILTGLGVALKVKVPAVCTFTVLVAVFVLPLKLPV